MIKDMKLNTMWIKFDQKIKKPKKTYILDFWGLLGFFKT